MSAAFVLIANHQNDPYVLEEAGGQILPSNATPFAAEVAALLLGMQRLLAAVRASNQHQQANGEKADGRRG